MVEAEEQQLESVVEALDESAVKLLFRLADQMIIVPEVSLTGIRYPMLRDLDDWGRALRVLEKHGFVEKIIYTRLVTCPACGSTNVATQYRCLRCDSYNLERTKIVQHLVCGYTDTEIRFEKYVCPKCGLRITAPEAELLSLGVVYECLECGSRTSRPKMVHLCMECDNVFTYREASYRPVYAFKVTDKGRRLVSRELVRSVVKKVFEAEGLRVEEDAELPGMSGVSHKYTLVVRKDGSPIAAIDIILGNEAEVLDAMVKRMDLSPDVEYIIITDNKEAIASRIAGSSNIRILDRRNVDAMVEELRSIVKASQKL